MRQWRTENCGHMTESGMGSIHKNWLFGPRTGLCSVWLSIKCIMGSQTPDLCKNNIFENQLLFNIDWYENRVTIHCSSVRCSYCPQPGVSSNFLAFLQNLRPGFVLRKPLNCVDTEITLSWDQIISSYVLKPFLILSCGHNPLSSSGAF